MTSVSGSPVQASSKTPRLTAPKAASAARRVIGVAVASTAFRMRRHRTVACLHGSRPPGALMLTGVRRFTAVVAAVLVVGATAACTGSSAPADRSISSPGPSSPTRHARAGHAAARRSLPRWAVSGCPGRPVRLDRRSAVLVLTRWSHDRGSVPGVNQERIGKQPAGNRSSRSRAGRVRLDRVRLERTGSCSSRCSAPGT